MKITPAIARTDDAPTANNRAIVNKLSDPGKASYKMALRQFIEIPASPLPSMIAAMYLKGIIPPRPKT